jgi:hypothetical protein
VSGQCKSRGRGHDLLLLFSPSDQNKAGGFPSVRKLIAMFAVVSSCYPLSLNPMPYVCTFSVPPTNMYRVSPTGITMHKQQQMR